MRPEGWEELGEHPCSGDGCLQCRDYANKEAGADAMLEGLKKSGEFMEADGRDPACYLVFIPEE